MKSRIRTTFFLVSFSLSSVHLFAQTIKDHSMAEHSAMAMMPVMAKSNEATKEQLQSARTEGKSVSTAIEVLMQQPCYAKGQQRAGEYKITYLLTRPEGWYEVNNEQLRWKQPAADANAHLWVFVQDGGDERIVPPLSITYSLQNETGKVTDEGPISYAWMPMVNGYGQNVTLAGTGSYHLKLTILPMPYRRHDPYNGDRFTHETIAVADFSFSPQASAAVLSEAMEGAQPSSAEAGKAYGKTLQLMYKQANDGRDTTAGDYTVAYAVEYAEGYWHYEGDKFRYMAENDMSGKTNTHIEISVRDAATGRFMDNLDIATTVKASDGTTIGTMKEPFMWHPWLYHYGENWRIPKTGKYTIVASIKPPAYHRYGKTVGQKFAHAIDIPFTNVVLKSGQK